MTAVVPHPRISQGAKRGRNLRGPGDLLVWDDHSGFGYAGPEDIKLLEQRRAAGVHYQRSHHLILRVTGSTATWRKVPSLTTCSAVTVATLSPLSSHLTGSL